jgi:hypothetical protein
MNLLFGTIRNREIILLPLLVGVVVIATWKVGGNKKWNGMEHSGFSGYYTIS